MTTKTRHARGARAGHVRVLLWAVACAVLALAPGPSGRSWAAQPGSVTPGATIVIGNDRGGSVRARVGEIQQIMRLGQRVEIRGRRCMSSCTMFLGLRDLCVSPRTVFTFHGPSYYGRTLSPAEFESWSRVIAAHYPEPLRSWYLSTGRTRIWNGYEMSGAELARYGIALCR
ncbi:hypothetical protein [Celeribacter indicus]|uniref:Uncharacterized protein n=1 Tax=Celeribacter indicus TaxID=1208324 RepID=A0A0B5DY36_9RHOB|nr:hypothetical protein [Celeribacter indicus]AJE46075.1 hypothetical protein P73_1360 [Celeribacter indicus]SDX44452.1 hypothetical protein SAMN05443573_12842 [Celeribacter indicus]